MSFDRRQFNFALATSLAGTFTGHFAGASSTRAADTASETGPLETFVPTRAITRGPLHHWFGYYDKQEFDPTSRYVLSNEVAFEGRSPRDGDSINVGYVDTADSDKWHPIGSSSA